MDTLDLLVALRPFLKHKPYCPAGYYDAAYPYRCWCGLKELLYVLVKVVK